MALTLVMMGAPMIKASASEFSKSQVSYEEKLEYVNREKAEFQAEYGTEDKYTKEEVNGATGDIRITYKETGKVEKGNFYEATKEQHKRYKMTEEQHDAYLKEQFK